ncbi:MAG: glycosyltransferase [Alphaproteobacteria bacterium]|nr:glycosyltransferase [Alphaproteobacteria bacterium]
MNPSSFYKLQLVKTYGHSGAEALYACPAASPKTIGLNTYFSSFYESYWRSYTNIGDLFFSFTLSGNAVLRLYRQRKERSPALVLEERCQGHEDRVHVALPSVDVLATGRLYAEIEFVDEATVVKDMAWETDRPPCRQASVAVVVCTFNREADVCQLLEKFVQASGVAEIIIVNHGERNLSQRLLPMLSASVKSTQITICDQRNLGGSGGFSRGMYIAQSHGKATHILLCDDDIDIDPDVMSRLAVIFSYSDDHLAVGGMMLDRLKPTWLHNNVTLFDDRLLKVVAPIPNCDLADVQNLSALAIAQKGDMNGWWCYAFSCSYLSETGFALPFFLHYDDAEFGLRLGKLGCSNVPWPGIAVWHEPFYVKGQSIRRYYDFRNVLYLFRLHGRLRRGACLRQFAWRFSINLVQYQYDSAWAILQAMADYLDGPSVLAAWDGSYHKAILTRADEWNEHRAPLSMAQDEDPVSSYVPKHESLALFGRIVWDLMRPAGRKPLVRLDPEKWSIWGATGYDAYAFYDEKENTLRVYRHRPLRAFGLLCRFIGLTLAFAVGWDRHWCVSALRKLSSLDYWKQKWPLY